jgi:hypothetical protein
MIKNTIYWIIIIGIVTFTGIMAQDANAQNGPAATGQYVANITVAGSSGPATIVIMQSGSNLGWTIHPEGANIRCIPKIPNIINPPTANHGLELTSGIYASNGTTNPTLEQDCISESGSTVPVSISIDTK